MSNDSLSTTDSSDRSDKDSVLVESESESRTKPWLTRVAIFVCIANYLGLTVADDYESWDNLSRFGYYSANEIWNGAYWAPISSVFVHFALWHLAFNVYWLWVFGSRLERAIGPLYYLFFFLVAAFVSSSFQLAVGDSTGIGASGVVYAMFGFMWLSRNRYPQFKEVLDERIFQLFIAWLFICIAITYLGVLQIGNAAHFSGLLFGGCVAGCFVVRYKPRLTFTALLAFVLLSIVPLFWCPWSKAWLGNKAYNAHSAGNYEQAIDYYTRLIQADRNDSWAYQNRSYAYGEIGELEKSEADYKKACEIDPSIVD